MSNKQLRYALLTMRFNDSEEEEKTASPIDELLLDAALIQDSMTLRKKRKQK